MRGVQQNNSHHKQLLSAGHQRRKKDAVLCPDEEHPRPGPFVSRLATTYTKESVHKILAG